MHQFGVSQRVRKYSSEEGMSAAACAQQPTARQLSGGQAHAALAKAVEAALRPRRAARRAGAEHRLWCAAAAAVCCPPPAAARRRSCLRGTGALHPMMALPTASGGEEWRRFAWCRMLPALNIMCMAAASQTPAALTHAHLAAQEAAACCTAGTASLPLSASGCGAAEGLGRWQNTRAAGRREAASTGACMTAFASKQRACHVSGAVAEAQPSRDESGGTRMP